MESNRAETGNRIRSLREARGKTQADIAKELHVKRETVNQWENGARGLKPEYTVKLADYFGVTCDFILRGVQAENVRIHQKLGLSEDAIEKLAARKKDANYVRTINLLLETQDRFQIITAITYYLADCARPGNIPYPRDANDKYKEILATHMEITHQGMNETRLVPYRALNEAYLMKVITQLSKLKDTLEKGAGALPRAE